VITNYLARTAGPPVAGVTGGGFRTTVEDAAYAHGIELRDLVAVIGKESLSELDLKYLEFADKFEDRFVRQGYDENRPIEVTLSIAWELLSDLPLAELKRIKEEWIDKYHPHKKKAKKMSANIPTDMKAGTDVDLGLGVSSDVGPIKVKKKPKL